MPRRLRRDYPGAWHHVMSRAIAKRTLFESDRDVRYFLACLARQVRSGDIEVYALVVLTTHFHLLVGSPRGRLSAAMQRALDAYARWFNRSRRRDGPLFRGRFANRVVEDGAYVVAVVRYIDHNPVSAGLAARPEDYAHGSARWYANGSGPPWLAREALLAWVRDHGGNADPRTAYREVFGPGFDMDRNAWVVERSLLGRAGERVDPLRLATPRDRRWMGRKSLLADGTSPGACVLHPDAVVEVVRLAGEEDPERRLRVRRKAYRFWEALACGALRDLSGLKHEEIAARTGLPVTGVRRRLAVHGEALRGDAAYGVAFGKVREEAGGREAAAVRR